MAVVDIMLRDMIDKHVVKNETLLLTGTASLDDANYGEASKLQVMTAICLLTGLCQIMFGILHLGAVSLILSDQLISGFSCGAAVNVILSQIPTALEMKGVSKASGPLSLVVVSTCHTPFPTRKTDPTDSSLPFRGQQAVSIGKNLHTCNKTALILSAVVLVVCVSYKELLEARLKRKVPFPIPIDLIIVSPCVRR